MEAARKMHAHGFGNQMKPHRQISQLKTFRYLMIRRKEGGERGYQENQLDVIKRIQSRPKVPVNSPSPAQGRVETKA